jgi:hypothetical protein
MLLSLLLWISTLTKSVAVQAPPPQIEQGPAAQLPDAESAAIYRVVVDWRFAHPGEGPKAERLIFLDTTVPYPCRGGGEEDCSAKVKNQLAIVFKNLVTPDVINDFLNRNSSQGPLSRTIPTDLPRVFLSRAEEDKFFDRKSHDGWELFYKKYPHAGGIMAFSRVGFNKSHEHALLYSEISCGWLCGTGHYHHLKKESGKWVLAGNYTAWIS